VSGADELRTVRRSAGLFALAGRGLVTVSGEDRARWLNGMVSNDVEALEPGPERSGCYAALLTPQGRIVADLHVMLREDAYWLETARAAVPGALEAMERLIIADDVTVEDRSDDWQRIALEGPRAPALLEAAAGRALPLADDCVGDVQIGGAPVAVAAFGFTGEPARQLFAPAARGDAVAAALREAAARAGIALAEPGDEAFEILRIEAGTPLYGSELALDTLPDEARIERAVSTRKGCYTGQEVVARLRSRGGVKHRLVGLRPAAGGATLPDAGATIARPARAGAGGSGGRRTGELTSRCVSPDLGPIALGFVHRDDAAAGTALVADGVELEVAELPFGVVDPADAPDVLPPSE